MIVLIPCKSLRGGKSRLAACLDAAQRQTLCAYFLTRTIELATGLAGSDRVRVVTSDPEAIAIAARCFVNSLDDAGTGLNAALTRAREEIRHSGLAPQQVMILPIDLPCATSESIAQAARTSADVLINSDESASGTNLLVLSPAAEAFQFCFGKGSFAAHLDQARRAGLSVQILEDPRLARDIDEPAQYNAWAASPEFPRGLMTAESVEALAGHSTAR